MAAPQDHLTVIKIAGMGGGGINIVSRMIEVGLKSVELIVMNIDAQALFMPDTETKLDIDRELTHGLGASADPNVGHQTVGDHIEEIINSLASAGMVFVTADEGDGIGTGATPVATRVAREVGAPMVDVTTCPFSFGGNHRAAQIEAGVEKLRGEVDILIVIPNNRPPETLDTNISVLDVFRTVDQVLLSGVQGIIELIITPGLINVGFNDARSVMKDADSALMGIGAATGEDRALRAVEIAIPSSFLGTSIDGAHGVLMPFQGGSNLGLQETFLSSRLIREAAHPETSIVFGLVIDDSLGGKVRVTIIATGLGEMETEASSSPVWQASMAKTPAAQAAPDPSPVPAVAAPAPHPVSETAAPCLLEEVFTIHPQYQAVVDVPTRTGVIPLVRRSRRPVERHEDQSLETP